MTSTVPPARRPGKEKPPAPKMAWRDGRGANGVSGEATTRGRVGSTVGYVARARSDRVVSRRVASRLPVRARLDAWDRLDRFVSLIPATESARTRAYLDGVDHGGGLAGVLAGGGSRRGGGGCARDDGGACGEGRLERFRAADRGRARGGDEGSRGEGTRRGDRRARRGGAAVGSRARSGRDRRGRRAGDDRRVHRRGPGARGSARVAPAGWVIDNELSARKDPSPLVCGTSISVGPTFGPMFIS